MNTYALSAIVDQGGVFSAKWTSPGDAADATRLCRQIGYLWLASKKVTTTQTQLLDPVASTLVNAYMTNVEFMTPKCLPSNLDPGFIGDIFGTGSLVATFRKTSTDDNQTEIITNLDKPIVTKGSLIVAITLEGVDISNQLDTQLRIPIGFGTDFQYLNIGTASANAQDGVYNNPFSAALGFATLANSAMTNTPVVIAAAQNAPRRIGGYSK